MIHASALETAGYTTIQVLDAESLERLRETYESLDLDPSHEFVATSNDLPRPVAEKVHTRIVDAISRHIEEILPDHEVFLSGFISKGAGVGAATAFHQDLTYTDERRHRATLLWIPLTDVDVESGALRVVPGSHRWTSGVRPSGLDELPTAPLQDLLEARSVTVPVPAGHAVVYDPALIHGAHTNTAPVPRPAVAVALAPRHAQLVHVHAGDDGELTAFEVDSRYHLEQGLFHRPEGYPEVPVWGQPVTEAGLRSAAAPSPVDPVATRPGPGRPRRGRTPWSTPPGDGVLTDPDLDAQLARQGYVTMPFTDDGTVAHLRGVYGVLHGWEGEGFEPDLNNPDSTYRRAVSVELERSLDESAAALFRQHRPFLRVFLCKWPGDGSDLYIHRDWMYTDERRGYRTYVVWVALQDITEENGPLEVVPGSHRFDPMLRGTDLNAPWLQHQDTLRERLCSVTAKAGDAIVFDNQLVHASPPNRTGEPRLVAAIGMRRHDAPLVYFHRHDASRADRYDVDEEFFLTQTPGQLLGARPDLEPVETVDVVHANVDAAELARSLDLHAPVGAGARVVRAARARVPFPRPPRVPAR